MTKCHRPPNDHLLMGIAQELSWASCSCCSLTVWNWLSHPVAWDHPVSVASTITNLNEKTGHLLKSSQCLDILVNFHFFPEYFHIVTTLWISVFLLKLFGNYTSPRSFAKVTVLNCFILLGRPTICNSTLIKYLSRSKWIEGKHCMNNIRGGGGVILKKMSKSLNNPNSAQLVLS